MKIHESNPEDSHVTPNIQIHGNIWGTAYYISHAEGAIRLKAAVLYENTSFRWKGNLYRVRRAGSINLVLSRGEEDIVRSTVSRRKRNIELHFDDRVIAISWGRKKFGTPIQLIENGVHIGTIGRRRHRNRKFSASLPDSISIPLKRLSSTYSPQHNELPPNG